MIFVSVSDSIPRRTLRGHDIVSQGTFAASRSRCLPQNGVRVERYRPSQRARVGLQSLEALGSEVEGAGSARVFAIEAQKVVVCTVLLNRRPSASSNDSTVDSK